MINKYNIFNEGKYFSSNGLQKYLVFMKTRYIKFISNSGRNSRIESWGSTGMSGEKIKKSTYFRCCFFPKLIGDYLFNNIVTFKGIYLKQDNVSFLHKNIVSLYIFYELDIWSKSLNTDFTLGNSLFGAMKLNKNVDPNKYRNIGYGIGFDSRPEFSWTDGSMGKMLFSVNCIVKWFEWQ